MQCWTCAQVGSLKNSYSFNTILDNANGLPVSIAVDDVAGQGITLVGSTNSAKLDDKGVEVCQANPVRTAAHPCACAWYFLRVFCLLKRQLLHLHGLLSRDVLHARCTCPCFCLADSGAVLQAASSSPTRLPTGSMSLVLGSYAT